MKNGFPSGSAVKNLPANAGNSGDLGQSLGQEDPLKEEMAIHSSVLAWEIPWTEEPGWLQSMGSQSQTQLITQALDLILIKYSGNIYS